MAINRGITQTGVQVYVDIGVNTQGTPSYGQFIAAPKQGVILHAISFIADQALNHDIDLYIGDYHLGVAEKVKDDLITFRSDTGEPVILPVDPGGSQTKYAVGYGLTARGGGTWNFEVWALLGSYGPQNPIGQWQPWSGPT